MKIHALLASYMVRGMNATVLESAELLGEVVERLDELYGHARAELERVNDVLRARGYGAGDSEGVASALDQQTARWRETCDKLAEIREILQVAEAEDPVPVLIGRLATS